MAGRASTTEHNIGTADGVICPDSASVSACNRDDDLEKELLDGFFEFKRSGAADGHNRDAALPTVRAKSMTDGGTREALSSSRSGSSLSTTYFSRNAHTSTRIYFPCHVYRMLEEASERGFDHIVSWNEAGTGFVVKDVPQFTDRVLPLYFNQSKYKSFLRQVCAPYLSLLGETIRVRWGYEWLFSLLPK